jgi:hypothetical protein
MENQECLRLLKIFIAILHSLFSAAAQLASQILPEENALCS